MYEECGACRVPLKPSPSLVYNNLCAVGGGLAYIHTRSAAVIAALPQQTGDSAINANKIDIQDYSLVQSITSCVVDGSSLLALGNEAGLQVWDGAGNNLLYIWKLPRSEYPSLQHADFVRGICFNMSSDGNVQLCVGCSSGSIQVFDIAPGMHIKPAALLKGHSRPVSALSSAFQSRHGAWADDLGCELVSCDDEGNICVWQGQNSTGYRETGVVMQTGVACSSLAVRKGFIIAAGTDGCVRIYGLKDGQQRYEIVAHSRWLSAMDIHPSKDLIATAAEDCTLGVWQLPIAGSKAACLLSKCSLHDVLTGVAFCGEGYDDVATVAYDTEALMLWKASSC